MKKRAIDNSLFTGLINDMDMKNPKYKLIYICVLLILCAVCVTTIFPTLWIFMSAFKSTEEFLQIPPTIIPRSFQPHKIVEVWGMLSFGKYLKNSVIIIIGTWICSVVFNGMAGYVFSKVKPLGSNFLFKIIFFTMLMPASMNMIPLYVEFTNFPILGINFTNTYIPLFMMSAISAFDILLFKNFFNSIPTSIVEAARVDGASQPGIFLRIILPLSKPIIVVVSIFAINGAWGNFFWPYMILKKESLQPVAVMLYNMQTQLSADKYMVLMMFSIVPPLVIFFLLSKHIIGGVSIGGVKG